jgi:hypothetical protein
MRDNVWSVALSTTGEYHAPHATHALGVGGVKSVGLLDGDVEQELEF